MAEFLERIKILLEAESSKAVSALKTVKTDIDEAESKFGKLKAAGGGVFDQLASAAPVALAGAGAAVGAFAVKSIGAFQDLALDVDKFTQKTGTSAEAASRWVEVSNDLGVSADATATAFGKFERQDAAGALDKFGLSATDTSGRFAELLGKIGAIPDQNEKAAAAFKIFGRSWQELSPLLDSTENLRDRLAEVGDSKIISQDQIRTARQFRDEMDDLSDTVEGFTIQIGSKLVEAANDLIAAAKQIGGPFADIAGNVKKADDASGGFLGTLTGVVSKLPTFANPLAQLKADAFLFGSGMDAASSGVSNLGDAMFGSTDAAVSLHKEVAQLGGTLRSAHVDEELFGVSMAAAAKAADAQTKSLDALNASMEKQTTAGLSAIDAQRGLAKAEQDADDANKNRIQTFADVFDAQKALTDAVRKHGASSKQAEKATDDLSKAQKTARDANQGTEDSFWAAAKAADQYATDQANAAGQTFTASDHIAAQRAELDKLKAKFPELSPVIDGMIAKLDQIPASKNVDVQVREHGLQDILNKLQNIPQQVFVDVFGKVHIGGAAAGGDFTAGQFAIVGERGPELIAFDSPSHVYTAAETQRMVGTFAPQDLGIPEGARGSINPPPYSIGRGGFGLANPAYGPTVALPPRIAGPGLEAPHPTIINVYMPPGSDGEDVVNALKRYQRRNGSIPITVSG